MDSIIPEIAEAIWDSNVGEWSLTLPLKIQKPISKQVPRPPRNLMLEQAA